MMPTTRSSQKIEVFDWDGTPVKEYVLNDDRFVQSFAMDLENNRIYGYCPYERDNNIIIYDLKYQPSN